MSYSAAARDYYDFDYEGNVTAKLNYDLIEHVEEPEPGENYFPLATTSIYDGMYRLTFTDVVVDEQTFDVQLSGDTVLDEQTVTATGSGPYTLDTTIYLEVSGNHLDQVFKIAFDNFFSNPTIASGEVHLDKFDDRQAFEWDHANRLAKAKKYTDTYNPTGDTYVVSFGNKGTRTLYLTTSKEYLYDVHDQLIRTEQYSETGPTRELTETQKYVYERGHCVVEFEVASGVDDAAYRLYGQGVDMPLAIDWADAFNTPIWTLTDHQGTVRDLAGSWVDGSFREEHVQYTPFGVPTVSGGLPGGVSTFYAGRELDRFTGLYNNRARLYDAGCGRFISEDPISFGGGDANLYRYCGNSPANATDPSGQIIVLAPVVGYLAYTGLAMVAAATVGAYYSWHEAEAAVADANDIDWNRMERAMWVADGSEVLAFTGATVATAPLAGVGGGAIAGLGPVGVGFNWGFGTTMLAGGVYGIGAEIHDISQHWDQMSVRQRSHRIGMLAGPTAGGIISGGLTGQAMYGVGKQGTRNFLLGGDQGSWRQKLYSANLRSGVYGRGFGYYNPATARGRRAAPRWDANHPLIEGTLDTPRSAEHKFLQRVMAEEMQASGQYQRVSMRQKLSEFSGLKHSPDIEPDNMGMTLDGRIDMIEIMSRWDTRKALTRKLLNARKQLPTEKRGEVHVIDPRDALR